MREIIMWLSKDARHLLVGYYVNIFNIDERSVCHHLDKPKWFEMPDWTAVLAEPNWIPILTRWLIKRAARNVKAYGDRHGAPTSEDPSADEFATRKEIRIEIKLRKRLQISNSELAKRKLITTHKHEHCDNVAGIGLTMEGYDLGRKYSLWWTRSGLWYAEYIKHHWISVVGSFVGGVLATLLVQWLSKG